MLSAQRHMLNNKILAYTSCGTLGSSFPASRFLQMGSRSYREGTSCPFRETSLWSNDFASHCSPCSHSCWSFGQWAIARLVLCHLWPVNFSPPQAATLYRKELAISHFLQISTWYTDSRIQKKKKWYMSPFLSMKSWVKKKKKIPEPFLIFPVLISLCSLAVNSSWYLT